MDGDFVFSPFEGILEKIVIESEQSGFLMPPEWEGEIRQRLTMRQNGSVTFTKYYISPRGNSKSMKHYRHKPTEKIMNYISEYFRGCHERVPVPDAGIWTAELSNTEGEKWSYCGSVCEDLEIRGYELSAVTRKILEIPDLWMFDGNNETE